MTAPNLKIPNDPSIMNTMLLAIFATRKSSPILTKTKHPHKLITFFMTKTTEKSSVKACSSTIKLPSPALKAAHYPMMQQVISQMHNCMKKVSINITLTRITRIIYSNSRITIIISFNSNATKTDV